MIKTREIAAVEMSGLTLLVRRAADQLASATTAAQVLEARDGASVAYDAAKKAARLAKAKGAHDELIAKAHRAQADALEIEALAKRRLADEYDAAQERGEVAGPTGNNLRSEAERKPTAADIGLTRKDIHEARTIRDAETAQPGVVRETLDAKLASGEEPTKAAVRSAVDKVNGKSAPASKPRTVSVAEYDALKAELEEVTEERDALRADVARLTAELATFADMKLEYERGGFAEIIANKDETIRVLQSRVASESHDKAAWSRSAKAAGKKLEQAGLGKDIYIDLDGPHG